jgi:hypothetical protein
VSAASGPAPVPALSGSPAESPSARSALDLLDDEALLTAFESEGFDPSAFHHPQHVRVVWAYLGRRPALEVLARFAAGLRRIAARAGKPGLYHETITWAYVLLVAERRAAAASGADGIAEDWPAFARRNPDLLAWRPSVLETRYYRPETLWSDRARAVFVMPDRGL